jgi:DNA-binding NarL/FixJ family response regulator
MIKVIVVDDHQMFIDGICELIKGMPEIEVVAQANDGVELIDALTKTIADVILMDVNMPKMDGLEATRHVAEHYPETKILILSMHDSSNYIQKLLKAGANGYILKNTGKAELQEAITKIADGETYYSATVTQRIMEGLQKQSKQKTNQQAELTAREKEVLKLIAQEFTTSEIAKKLFISHHTVESHRKNLIAKLGVRNIAGLVKYAMDAGIVN